MKNRIAIISAVLVVGLVILGVYSWQLSSEEAEKDGRAQWERSTARWRARAADALEQKVSSTTVVMLGDLVADAQRLQREQPARANSSEFRSALVRVEAFFEKVRRIDWEEVIKWEREVQAVADDLRRAMAEAKNWDEERGTVVRAAEARWQELRPARPWGADDEPEENVRQAIAFARAPTPPGRR